MTTQTELRKIDDTKREAGGIDDRERQAELMRERQVSKIDSKKKERDIVYTFYKT